MSTISYQCPSCGAPLKWDAEKQQYSCEYCGSVYSAETLAELSPREAQAEEIPAADRGEEQKIRVYHCPSCGAQIVTDATTAASSCYYCHTPVVLEDRLEGGFRPQKIVPFSVDREKAQQIFSDWLRKHRYTPASFTSGSRVEELTGVYFPYWLYNAKVHGTLHGTAEKDRVWVSGEMQHIETSTFRIDREGDMPVSNISRLALNKASRVLCESVAPFDFGALRPFEYGYLSGFLAEVRDVKKEDVAEDIRQEVKNYAASQLQGQSQGNYTRISITSLVTKTLEERFEYVLLPVWTLTFRGNDGKIWYFSVNGSTGKTVGELPADRKKLLLLFVKVFVPVLAVLLLLFWLIS